MSTTAMTDVVELIRLRHPNSRIFLAGLNSEAWSRPSACAGWTVGDVVAHLTQGARTWSEAITRARAGDFNMPPGQPPLRPGERGLRPRRSAPSISARMGEAALLQAFASDYQRLHQILLAPT